MASVSGKLLLYEYVEGETKVYLDSQKLKDSGMSDREERSIYKVTLGTESVNGSFFGGGLTSNNVTISINSSLRNDYQPWATNVTVYYTESSSGSSGSSSSYGGSSSSSSTRSYSGDFLYYWYGTTDGHVALSGDKLKAKYLSMDDIKDINVITIDGESRNVTYMSGDFTDGSIKFKPSTAYSKRYETSANVVIKINASSVSSSPPSPPSSSGSSGASASIRKGPFKASGRYLFMQSSKNASSFYIGVSKLKEGGISYEFMKDVTAVQIEDDLYGVTYYSGTYDSLMIQLNVTGNISETYFAHTSITMFSDTAPYGTPVKGDALDVVDFRPVQRAFYQSREVTKIYQGGNLIWQKPS